MSTIPKDEQEPDPMHLAQRVSDHLETRLEYMRLVVTEKFSIALVKGLSAGLLAKLLGLFLFFINLAAALWIGRHYDDYVIGFGAVALFYLAITLVYLLFRKLFERKMIDSAVTSMCAEQEHNENNDDDEDEA